MPQNKARLFQKFTGGVRVGSSSANYVEINSSGVQTAAGTGRVRKSIYLLPSNFSVPVGVVVAGASPGTDSGCNAGSMMTGCLVFDISTSSITTCATTNLNVPVLVSGCLAASPASRLWATTFVPKPRDADTTGSIIAYVDWSYGDAPIQSGCKKSMIVSLGYLDGLATTPNSVRTAASAGGASAASYVGTACGKIMSTCLGKLPSFTASDSGALVLFQLGASAASEDGTLKTGCTFIIGVRLDYMANSLGTASDE